MFAGGIETIRFLVPETGAQFPEQFAGRRDQTQLAAQFAHNRGRKLLLPFPQVGGPSEEGVKFKAHRSTFDRSGRRRPQDGGGPPDGRVSRVFH